MARAEALARQQESLRAVIESISSELQLRPLLTRIVRHACELIGADNGTIGLVDAHRDLIRTEAVWQMPPEELGAEMPRGVGLAGAVLASGEPLVLEHYGAVPQPTLPELARNAVVGIPIWWREELIGFFGIGMDAARRSRPFTPDDVETLTLFARHAAIAIENARLYAAREQALQEMALLYSTGAKIGTALSTREVVAAYLELVAIGRGQLACSVTCYEPGRTQVSVLGRWLPGQGLDLEPVRYPSTPDALDTLLDQGETIAISDVWSDPRVPETLRRIQAESGRQALALIPLRVAGKARLGHVVLSQAAVHTWSAEELHPFQITAQQLASALESRLQQERLAAQAQKMAIFEERQRIARELHDSVTQLLFSMTLIAQTAASAWERDPAEGRQRLERLVVLSQTALAEMRSLLAELRPNAPESPPLPGLVEALERHLAVLGDGVTPILVDAKRYRPCPPETEQALLRIAQEAIGNACRHAQAQRIQVRLATTRTGKTTLRVEDDGIGFDARAARQARHAGSGVGLSSMRERAQTLGARFGVRTRPGGGTRVEVVLGG